MEIGETLTVHGGASLSGSIPASGFKHSLVTVAAAALAANAPVEIHNCPSIAETSVFVEIVTRLGGRAVHSGSVLTIDGRDLADQRLDADLAGRIHGSVYLLPALLARFGKAVLPGSGGCRIGDGPAGLRPTAQYAGVLRRFGAQVDTTTDGGLDIAADHLAGCEIDLLDYTADRVLRTGPQYSGATKMALLTAALADGESVLHNPYPKPDVTDLVDVLRGLGCAVDTTAAGSLVVRGAALDRPVRHELIPDLIEVVTWVCAGAVLGSGPIRVTGPGMSRAVTALAPEFAVFDRMGIRLDLGRDELTVYPADRLRPVDVTIASHGVYSDSQPFLALLATHAAGRSAITETVWANRFGYLPGLCALGADGSVTGRTLLVRGPCPPHRPARLHAPDLRAAAMLLLAALAAPGSSTLSGARHLTRGYPDLPGALRSLGATITTAKGDR